MNESQLTDGARTRLADLEAAIREHETFLERTRKELSERMYRAGGEQTVEITTLGAVIKTRQLKLDNDRQAFMRFRMKIAQLPSNTVLHDVPPPEPTDDETLESVRAEISSLRAKQRVLKHAADTTEDMLPIIEKAVRAIPIATPTILKDGTTKFPPGTHPASIELYGADSDHDVLIKTRAATYAAQLGDSDVVWRGVCGAHHEDHGDKRSP